MKSSFTTSAIAAIAAITLNPFNTGAQPMFPFSPNHIPLVVIDGPPPTGAAAAATGETTLVVEDIDFTDEQTFSIQIPSISSSAEDLRIDAYFVWVDENTSTGNLQLAFASSGNALGSSIFDTGGGRFGGSDTFEVDSSTWLEIDFEIKESGLRNHSPALKRGYILFLGTLEDGNTEYQMVKVYRVNLAD